VEAGGSSATGEARGLSNAVLRATGSAREAPEADNTPVGVAGAALPAPASGAVWNTPVPKAESRRPEEGKPPVAASGNSSGRAAKSAAMQPEPEPAESTPRAALSEVAFTGSLTPMDADGGQPPPPPAAASAGEFQAGTNLTAADGSEPPDERGGAAETASRAMPAAGASTGSDAPDAAPIPNSLHAQGAGATPGPAILGRPHGPSAAAGSTAEATSSALAGPGAGTAAAQRQKGEGAGGTNGQPEAARADGEPRAAIPQKAAHDITLELDSGSQRAAVRVVERGGEVRFAVRTPDPELAAGLRQGLPALAARLEQVGFRAGNWHAAAEPRHSAEAPAAAAQHRNQQNGPGSERERRDGRPAHEETPQPRGAKNAGKDFAWFMSSLG
jgi:hypothetical protein